MPEYQNVFIVEGQRELGDVVHGTRRRSLVEGTERSESESVGSKRVQVAIVDGAVTGVARMLPSAVSIALLAVSVEVRFGISVVRGVVPPLEPVLNPIPEVATRDDVAKEVVLRVIVVSASPVEGAGGVR